MNECRFVNDPTGAASRLGGKALVVVAVATLSLVLAGGMDARADYDEDEEFRVYVTNKGTDNISVIETATGEVIATVPGGDAPRELAVMPDSSKVYVTNEASDTITVIETLTNTVVATITDVGPFPVGIDITPDGSRAYVCSWAGSDVWVIDTASNTVVDSIPLGMATGMLDISPDGGMAYCSVRNILWPLTAPNTPYVAAVDTETKDVTLVDVAGDRPYYIRVQPIDAHLSPDGQFLYVTCIQANFADITQFSYVAVIDTSLIGVADDPVVDTMEFEEYPLDEDAVIDEIEVGYSPRVAFYRVGDDEDRVYISNRGGDTLWPPGKTVSVIDPSINEVVATVEVGWMPTCLAVTPDDDGSRLYVANKTTETPGTEGSVSVVDTATNTVIDTIDVGGSPTGVGIARFDWDQYWDLFDE